MIKNKKRNKINWSKIKLVVSDFDGVMTDGFAYVDEGGKESVRVSRKDGLGIGMLKKKGIEFVVLSREKNGVVQARCKKLEIECFTGVESKLQNFISIVESKGFSFSEVCYIGDDIIDIECLKKAGIGVTVADAEKEIKKSANFVTKRAGGDHAVRELCDIIIKEIH